MCARILDPAAWWQKIMGPPDGAQFGLLSLFESLTVCGLVLAAAGMLGPVTASILLAMTLALAARQGWLTLVLLCGAVTSAATPTTVEDERYSLGRITAVAAVAMAVCAWYAWRRLRKQTPIPQQHNAHPCGVDGAEILNRRARLWCASATFRPNSPLGFRSGECHDRASRPL